MNILFRNIDKLCINLTNALDRAYYYQDHYYDNVYIIDNNGRYVGYYNLSNDFEQTQGVVSQLFIDHPLDGVTLNTWFIKHPAVFRLPLVIGGELCGEYYDASSTGACLYKTIEDKALKIVKLFAQAIQEYYGTNEFHFIGHADSIKVINDVLFDIDSNDIEHKDYLSVDLSLTTHFRRKLYGGTNGIITLSELLLPILIKQLAKFLHDMGIEFYAVDGLLKSEIEISYPQKELPIERLLQDEYVIRHFCGCDIESFAFLQRHRYDLNRISKILSNGIHNILLDKQLNGFNVVDGKRFTTGNSDGPNKYIHIYGPCVVQGLCVIDSQTIPSILQKLINQEGFTNVSVINHGLSYGKDLLNDILYMMATPLAKGDVVVWMNGFTKEEEALLGSNSIPVIDAKSVALNHPDWYLNIPFHCNANSNYEYACKIMNVLRCNLYSCIINRQSEVNCLMYNGIDLDYNPDELLDSKQLAEYLDEISSADFCQPDKTKGCVVINANPFTYGHLFLIEEALRFVDLLYIFLVEENNGLFSYIDREYMVKEALHGNSRVRILSGGSVLTAEIGFPEYFNKDNSTHTINPILNHKIFGLRIAPKLDITYRFFGEESEDLVTKTLNETAKEYLPACGISVSIIERLKINGSIVSAKEVRRLYEQGDFDSLGTLVPSSTMERFLQLKLRKFKAIPFPLPNNGTGYPGMVPKFETNIKGEDYILKTPHNSEEILSAFSEIIGSILCKQLSICCSDIHMVLYNEKISTISKCWRFDCQSQFFPLASYYEELIETRGYVRFTYSLFKEIVRKKCSKTYEDVLCTFWKTFIIDYLLCNARSAGNIGFIDSGEICLSPMYDFSTWLCGINDNSYENLKLPILLMEFCYEDNSGYYVLRNFEDQYKEYALEFVRQHLALDKLFDYCTEPEELFLYRVIKYRYDELYK